MSLLNITRSLTTLLVLIMLPTLSAQESVPAELRTLLEQYNAKLLADSKPVTEKLLAEMKKLEQKLVNERRLSDALSVQEKHKQISSATKLANDPLIEDDFVPVQSKSELKNAISNTVWVFRHEGNGSILNVVVLNRDGTCLISGVAKAKWKVVDEFKVEISADSLPSTGIINLSVKNRFTYQYGNGVVDKCEFCGRFTLKKN